MSALSKQELEAKLRTFVGVDGEFGQRRAPGAELPLDAPRLPRWTVGITLGATVGTP